MKKSIFILALLIVSNNVFAACPVESEGSACIAEFQQTNIPVLPNLDSQLSTPPPVNKFIETPATVDSSREIEPKKKLRSFSSNNQDYGYNSNCQFGVCLDRGTPKLFPERNN